MIIQEDTAFSLLAEGGVFLYTSRKIETLSLIKSEGIVCVVKILPR